jgi:hypothetical protein
VTETATNASRPLSKYQQKKQERAAGTRPEFDFATQRRREPEHFDLLAIPKMTVYGPPQAPVINRQAPAPALVPEKIVRPPQQKMRRVATVKRLANGPSDMKILLKSTDGEDITLSPSGLRQLHLHDTLQKGNVIECDVVPNSGGNSFRVVEIISVTPPPDVPSAP